MALVITLKPHEKLFIGGAVIENGATKAEFTVINDVPILREKEILREPEACTPATRIYLAIQMMYMDAEHVAEYVRNLNQFVQDMAQAAPSTVPLLEKMVAHVQNQRFYMGLKEARRLINYEEELLRYGQVAD
jgi:flagellar biosynthesis repressor protein FlbT